MLEIRTLIKCDKCGSTKVNDEEIREIQEKTVTMNEWIKNHKTRSAYNFVSTNTSFVGTSHGERRRLVCTDCGFTKEYHVVVYT